MESIQEKFKQKRNRQIAVAVILFPSIFGMSYISNNPEGELGGISNYVLLFLLIGLIIGGVIFSIINWRCPSCNAYLGKKLSQKYCSSCGTKLS